MIDLESVDIKALFDSLDIEYKSSGKNVSHGWVNINCPIPGCGDSSFHCGINLRTSLFSCWICQEKGSIVKLIREIKDISFGEANKIVKGFERDSSLDPFSEKDPESANSGVRNSSILVYPDPLLTVVPEPHRQYLISRQFDPDLLAKKYDLKFTYNTGNFRFRIIAPIFWKGKAVSWIAADVVRKDAPPYIKCPVEMSIKSANDCLYNIDSVNSVAILTEGVTDVWRMGDGTVASMTKAISASQIRQLLEKKVKKVFVMYDADAIDRAKKVAAKLSGFFETEILELSEGDPADLSLSEVIDLRAEIFSN